MLSDPRLFPILLMLLNTGAAIRYGLAGNAGQALYWAAALVLNFAVTFLMGK